jgi:hypothetical protein
VYRIASKYSDRHYPCFHHLLSVFTISRLKRPEGFVKRNSTNQKKLCGGNRDGHSRLCFPFHNEFPLYPGMRSVSTSESGGGMSIGGLILAALAAEVTPHIHSTDTHSTPQDYLSTSIPINNSILTFHLLTSASKLRSDTCFL